MVLGEWFALAEGSPAEISVCEQMRDELALRGEA